MTKRTAIILAATTQFGDNRHDYPHLRVKLDRHGFPYVVIDNEKHIITATRFPQAIWAFGEVYGELTLVSGAEELAAVLANPDLTVDKLSLHNLCRVTS